MQIWPQKMEQILKIATCNYELLLTKKVTLHSKLKILDRLDHVTPRLKLYLLVEC